MGLADYETLMTQAKNAIAASDWHTAKSKLMQAEVELASAPRDNEDRGRIMRYRETIGSLRQMVEREMQAESAAHSGGLQRSKVNYVRATD